jgi:hypothetical protein
MERTIEESEWLPLPAARHIEKTHAKLCGMVGLITRLDRNVYDRMTDAFPDMPEGATGLNRLAWLKYLTATMPMMLNVINNEIKTIEEHEKK